ncbi:MAG: hypothetical protein VYC34_06225 [Planctomycetota bacterium]|nr:hypothetical protein [Planctomycetota bacterium]
MNSHRDMPELPSELNDVLGRVERLAAADRARPADDIGRRIADRSAAALRTGAAPPAAIRFPAVLRGLALAAVLTLAVTAFVLLSRPGPAPAPNDADTLASAIEADLELWSSSEFASLSSEDAALLEISLDLAELRGSLDRLWPEHDELLAEDAL